MNATLAVALSVLVIVLLAAAFLINLAPGAATSTSSTGSTETQSTTSVGTGGYVNSTENLQLRLSVNASSTGGSDGGVSIQILASEDNTLASANNVSAATEWGLDGLSLGSCGRGAYPFGVALYSGAYTAGNVSEATPLQIYPIVPCPMFIRLVTGYLFQPASDLAVVLPSSPDATATEMSSNVTATAEYSSGRSLTSSAPLGPGTYTVAAGDEWGSVVEVHFTIGARTVTTSADALGALGIQLAIVSATLSASSSFGGDEHPRISRGVANLRPWLGERL